MRPGFVNTAHTIGQELVAGGLEDDGPGFPEDIIKALGEPYIKSRSKLSKNNAGLGLGTFLGKTLLERKSAVISFENGGVLNGARVKIKWTINDLSVLS